MSKRWMGSFEQGAGWIDNENRECQVKKSRCIPKKRKRSFVMPSCNKAMSSMRCLCRSRLLSLKLRCLCQMSIGHSANTVRVLLAIRLPFHMAVLLVTIPSCFNGF